jgi:flagellar biosynthesis protein FlhA
VVGVMPGMPLMVFGPLAGAFAAMAFYAFKRKDIRTAQAAADIAGPDTGPREEPISTALAMDLLRVELGYGLLTLINDVQGHKITDQIKALRRQLAQEMGFVMPAVRILDNMTLGANEYRIRIKEFDSGKGELFPGSFLIMDPKGLPIDLPGTHTTEPAFGLPATWVSGALKEEASFRGFTVVDPGTVLTTHLTEVLKSHMAELLSYAETKKLLDDLPPENKKLVEELIPSQISVTGVQRVLQTLLAERVSIRDLPAVLEGIAEAVGHTKNALYITEHVRARLARQLCHANLSHAGYLPLIALSPHWEQAFSESIIGSGEERQLAMAPSQLQLFIQSVREAFDEASQKNEVPVLLTSPQIRPFVRSIIERFRAQSVVMSQNEIHASVRLRTLGQV